MSVDEFPSSSPICGNLRNLRISVLLRPLIVYPQMTQIFADLGGAIDSRTCRSVDERRCRACGDYLKGLDEYEPICPECGTRAKLPGRSAIRD